MFPRIRDWLITAIAFATFMAPMFAAGYEANEPPPAVITE